MKLIVLADKKLFLLNHNPSHITAFDHDNGDELHYVVVIYNNDS